MTRGPGSVGGSSSSGGSQPQSGLPLVANRTWPSARCRTLLTSSPLTSCLQRSPRLHSGVLTRWPKCSWQLKPPPMSTLRQFAPSKHTAHPAAPPAPATGQRGQSPRPPVRFCSVFFRPELKSLSIWPSTCCCTSPAQHSAASTAQQAQRSAQRPPGRCTASRPPAQSRVAAPKAPRTRALPPAPRAAGVHPGLQAVRPLQLAAAAGAKVPSGAGEGRAQEKGAPAGALTLHDARRLAALLLAAGLQGIVRRPRSSAACAAAHRDRHRVALDTLQHSAACTAGLESLPMD